MLRDIDLNKENCLKNELLPKRIKSQCQSSRLIEDVKIQYEKMRSRFDEVRKLGLIENFPLLKVGKLNEMSNNELLVLYDELLEQETNLEKNYSKLMHGKNRKNAQIESKNIEVDYSVLKNVWERRAGKSELNAEQNIDRLNKNIASIKSSINAITSQQYEIMGIDMENGYKKSNKNSINSLPFILSEFILQSKEYKQLQQQNDALKTAIKKYRDLQMKLQKSYDTIQRLKEQIKMQKDRYCSLQEQNSQLNEKNSLLQENEINLCTKMAEITQQNLRKNIQLMQLSRKDSNMLNSSICSLRNMSISFDQLSKMSIIPRQSLPLDLEGVDLARSQYLPEEKNQHQHQDKDKEKDKQIDLHSIASELQASQDEQVGNRKKNIKFMRRTRVR